jgi:hypothetical protein
VIDREALVTAVRETADYDGLTGMLTCSEVVNAALVACHRLQVKTVPGAGGCAPRPDGNARE